MHTNLNSFNGLIVNHHFVVKELEFEYLKKFAKLLCQCKQYLFNHCSISKNLENTPQKLNKYYDIQTRLPFII